MSVTELAEFASAARLRASVFPLPLTTLESFMLADARPRHPMMCDIELDFEGVLDRESFDAAFAFAIARNPLFACRVERGARGSACWVPAERPPVVRWIDLETPLDDSYGAMALVDDECGLRVWVRTGSAQTKLLLHFHHACADALGSFGFLGDLLAGYAIASRGAGPQSNVRELDFARLTSRGQAGLDNRSLARRIHDGIVGAKEGIKFFLQAPQTLAPARSPSSDHDSSPRPIYTTATLDEATARGLRRKATAANATTNDLLLRDLYVTMRQWNVAHDDPPGRRRLRILMPQNLRTNADYAMPAANVMSFAFVTRRAHMCDEPETLLDSIREETEAVRKGRLSLYFLGGLQALQANRLLDTVLNRPFCFATAILTNLGDPFRRFGTSFARSNGGLLVGDVTLRGMAAVPPLRPQTRAAFAVSSSGSKLSINLKWDPEYLSPLDAESLLGHYVAQLRTTAQWSG